MSFYKTHVFFCVNQRTNGKKCCHDANADVVRAYVKDRIKALGLSGEKGIRINKSGCLGRCDEGPVLVVYSEGVWYTYETKDDVDEIIEKHLLNGQVVERLLLRGE